MTKILGIDPGLSRSGWGIIKATGNERLHIAHGVIKTTSQDITSLRLGHLCTSLEDIICTYKPQEVAIEQTFVNNNSKSALLLAMARGALMSIPARYNLIVHEYGANVVKKAVVGFGHADKAQVSYMVKLLLNYREALANDASDALAIGLCHSNTRQFIEIVI